MERYDLKWLPIHKLKWGEGTINRSLSKQQVRELVVAISKTSIVLPILCDQDLNVIDGQHRCQAVFELHGSTAEVPVIILPDSKARMTILFNTEKPDNLNNILEKTRKLLGSTTDLAVPFTGWSNETGVPLWAILLLYVPVKWKSLHRDNLKIFVADDLVFLSDLLLINEQMQNFLPAYENVLKTTTDNDFEKSRAMNSLIQAEVKSHFQLKRGQKLPLEALSEWQAITTQKASEVASKWNF